jgi:flagellar basal-body rod protein FlgB
VNFFDALDRSIAPVVQGLGQRSRRHGAIASNVANADTPGYRAVDVSFGQQLQRARMGLRTTHPGHRNGSAGGGLSGRDAVVFSGGLPRRDGNDVDIDREMGKLAQNQIEYQFLARRLSSKFGKLREAITGKAG